MLLIGKECWRGVKALELAEEWTVARRRPVEARGMIRILQGRIGEAGGAGANGGVRVERCEEA